MASLNLRMSQTYLRLKATELSISSALGIVFKHDEMR